ncbi:MAG: tetratricopeptide (TPR) repeat protein [Paraglaciecola sp.]|jgi:tetratricopeptide (TPR) repeat protein
MTYKFLFIFSFLVLGNSISGQTLRALEKAATKAYAAEDYYSAMTHLADALQIEDKNPRLWFKYAEVCRQFNAHDLAEEYYTKIVENNDAKQFPLTWFWLGMTKKKLGKYDDAIVCFEGFNKVQSTENQFGKQAKDEIKACQWAMNLEPDSTMQTKIIHLDKKVNTPYSEFGGIELENMFYYTSYRYKNKEDKHDPPRNVSKNLYATKEAKGRLMKRNFNADEKLTAHTAFGNNQRRIYFTICEYVNAGKIRCDLFYKELDKRNRWKMASVKLPETINLVGFTVTHPAIGFDSLTQKEVLFFVSDKKGGKGGLDIWYSEIEGEKFSEPKNLAAVNTKKDDITPFFHNATQTLFFSSDGHQNMGGYDVFKIKKVVDWEAVENMGVPLNSSFNDLYFTMNETSEKAYFSSNRPGSFYLDKSNKTCCYDIYKADFKEVEPIPAVTSNVAELPTPEPELPKALPVPTNLQDFLPLALYFHNDEPDRRTRRTYTKKSYENTYLTYYNRKQEYLTEYTKPLDEEQTFEAEQLIDDFFEDEVRKGYEHLFLFSDILLKRLEKGETVEIFIKGYTSPRAKGDYNLSLGKRRISSLRNHFDTHRNGIFLSYLNTKNLIVTERSFGETTASTNVSDDLEDMRNSVYSVGAAKERRVEIVEIMVGK